MQSIPLAMTWEMLRRGRWSLLGALFGAILFPLLLLTALQHDGAIDPEEPSLIIVHVVMTQISMFIFAAGIFTAQGHPSRLFAFPVPTTTLVTWHLLPAMAAMACGSLLTTSLFNALFDLGWPLWGPALFVAVALAAINAVLWFTEKTFWLLWGLTLVGGGLGLWLKSRYGAPFSQPTRLWLQVTPAETLTLLGIAVLAWFAAVAGVSRSRRGDTIPPLGIVAWIIRTFDRAPDLGLPFRSPAQAQFWFEWTKKGWAMPVSVAFGTVLGLCGWLLFNRKPEDLYHGFVAGGAILSAAAFVAGLIMGNSGPNDADYAMGGFLATRPITDTDMSRTILKTAGQSVIVAWAIWAFSFLTLYAILRLAHVTIPPSLPKELGWWYFPATLLGPWIIAAVGAAVGLADRPVLVAKLACGLFALFIGLTVFARFSLSLPARTQLWYGTLGVCAAVLALGTVWTFVAARRRALIGSSTVYVAAALWCVLATPVVTEWVLHPDGPADLYMVAITALALAVAPLAAVPLALCFNRHR
jgi:hypothetical protein